MICHRRHHDSCLPRRRLALSGVGLAFLFCSLLSWPALAQMSIGVRFEFKSIAPGDRAPKASVSASTLSVQGGGTVTLSASALDPDGDTLTYYWEVSGGKLSGSAPHTAVTWTAPVVVRATTYAIYCEVGDRKGLVDRVTTQVTVLPGANPGDQSSPYLSVTSLAGSTFTAGAQVVLTWSASDPGGVSYFDVEGWDTAQSAWTSLKTKLAKTTQSYAWSATTGISNLRITAHDSAGNAASASTGPFTVVTSPMAVVPAAPRLDILGVATPNSYVDVSWKAVSNAQSYVLYIAEGSPTNKTSEHSLTGTTYRAAGLKNSTWYFKVKAKNAAGESGWSSLRSIIVAANHAPPAAGSPSPADKASGVKRQGTVLSWQNQADPEGDTIVFRPFFGKDPNNLLSLRGFNSTTSESLSTLEAGTTYYWQVETRDSKGLVARSPLWRFTTASGQADLQAVSATVSGTVMLGNTVDVAVTVKNVGGFASKATNVALYLSATAGAKAKKIVGGDIFLPDLKPGAQVTVTKKVALTSYPAKNFYIDAEVEVNFSGDANSANNLVSAAAQFLDKSPPTVTFGGEAAYATLFGAGKSMDVHFRAQDDGKVTSCALAYQQLPSGSWQPIVVLTQPIPNSLDTYRTSWTVPTSLVGHSFRLRASCQDDGGHTGVGYSNNIAVQNLTPPTVKVLWPTGGETLVAGKQYTIQWHATAPCGVDRVDISWSLVSGGYYGYLAYNKTVSDGAGSLTYTVKQSDIKGSPVKIRVEAYAGSCGVGAKALSNAISVVSAFKRPAGFGTPEAPFGTSLTISQDYAMTVSKGGEIHVVGLGGSPESVRYARRTTGGVWQQATLQSSVSGANSFGIALDPQQNPHVVWTHGGKVYYTAHNGSSWQSPQQLSSASVTAYHSRVGAFPNGDVIVSYWQRDTTPRQIRYRIKSGSTWSAYQVAPTKLIGYHSMNVDGQGRVHLSSNHYDHVQKIDYAPGYAVLSGGSWSAIDTTFNAYMNNTNGHLATVDHADTPYFYAKGGSTTEPTQLFKKGASGWTKVPLPALSGEWVTYSFPLRSLVFDEQNEPLLLRHQHLSNGYEATLLYSRAAGTWNPPLQYEDENSENHLIDYNTAQKRFYYCYRQTGVVYCNSADWSVDRYAPVVSVIKPGAATVKAGAAVQVQWSVSDNVGVTSQDVYWVESDGTKHLIGSPAAGTSSLSWTAPSGAHKQVHVLVVAKDSAGNEGSAGSAAFDIGDGTAPLVQVTVPATGASLSAGSSAAIAWTATDNVKVTGVDLYYRSSASGTWTLIAKGLANSGSYAWTVPYLNSSGVQVKAVAWDAAKNSAEDLSGVFSVVFVAGSQFVVYDLHPADGAVLVSTTGALTWKAHNTTGSAATFDVYFAKDKSLVDGKSTTARIAAGAALTSASPGGMVYSTTYYWRVVGTAGSKGADSGTMRFSSESRSLAAPSNLKAVAVAGSTSTAKLSWTDNATSEDGYRVEVSQDGVSYTKLTTTGKNSTSYSASGLKPNATYFFIVRAFAGTQLSASSNVATVTTGNRPPNAPVLSAPADGTSGASATSLTLSWTGSDPDPGDTLTYALRLGSSPSPALYAAGISGNSYTARNLGHNRVYYWQVVARDNHGGEMASKVWSFSTQNLVTPAAPTGLTASYAGKLVVNLSWTDTSNIETGFWVERKRGTAGTWGVVGMATANQTAYQDAVAVVPANTYFYRVRAFNSAGTSVASNEAQVVVPNTAPQISPPIPNITLDWSGPKRVDLAYYKSDLSDPPSKLVYSISGVDTSLLQAKFSGDTLTITPIKGKSGSDTVTISLTDSQGATDTQTATLTVVGSASTPVWAALPAVKTDKDKAKAKALDLWSYVSDAKVADKDLALTVNSSSAVGAGVILEQGRYVSVYPQQGWTGYGELVLRADNGINSSDTKLAVYVGIKPDGDPCKSSGDCKSAHCSSDGVCCDKACSGGCDVCSKAKGATKDGVCTLLPATAVCRAAAGICDLAELCDGTSAACPKDLYKAHLSPCPGGVCIGGACLAVPDGGLDGGLDGTGGDADGAGDGRPNDGQTSEGIRSDNGPIEGGAAPDGPTGDGPQVTADAGNPVGGDSGCAVPPDSGDNATGALLLLGLLLLRRKRH